MDKILEDAQANLAKNLIAIRRAQGLNQEQFSKITGLPRSTLSYIESGTGNPSLENLIKIASSLNLSIQELIGKSHAEFEHFENKQLKKNTKGNGGITITHILPDAVKNIQLELLEFQANSQFNGLPHIRGSKEFFHCLSGNIEIKLERGIHIIKAGETFIFPGDQKHSYRNITNKISTAISSVFLPI